MNPPKEIMQIPIEDIIPNRFQPRIAFDEKALNELAASIKQHGIIQPLVVRRLGEKYEIIAGERRYKAATIAGLTSVPAVITVIDDQTSAEVALVENVQRKDLTAIEEAKSYKNLLDKGGLTQEELAQKMGLSQSAVANKLRLLNLAPEVQNALLNEQISERHARALLRLSSNEEQVKWLQRVITERLTVRQLDSMLKNDGNEEEEDVPLVDINQNIDDIKSNATDIIRETATDNIEPDDVERPNRFFNYLEEEPINMGPTAPVNPPVVEEPVANVYETTAVAAEPRVFEEIETLDIAPETVTPVETAAPVSISSPEAIETIAPKEIEEPKTEFSEIVNGIRNKVEELNTAQNITIEEMDMSNSYKIEITINKES